MMKKILCFNYFLLFVILGLVTSCDKDADEKLTSYSMVNVSFKYPFNSTEDYTIYVNGNASKEIGGTFYIPSNLSSATIEVIDNKTGIKIYTKKNVPLEQEIKLIKLPGKDIDIYSEDKYSLVKVTIVDEQGNALSKDDFTASFNGQNLDFSNNAGTSNYFLKEDLTKEGTFILRDKNGIEIFKQTNIKLRENGNISVIRNKYVPSGYLYLPAINDPVDKYHPIIRFLYFNEGKDSFKGAIKLKIKLYSKNNKTPSLDTQFIGETELLPGLISDGVTIDLNKYWPGLMGGQISVEIIKIKSDGNEEKLLSIDDRKYVGANQVFKLVTILVQNTNPETISDKDFDPRKIKLTRYLEQIKW